MAHFNGQSDPSPKIGEVFLSAAQFEELKELLRPGAELAKRYLAQLDEPVQPKAESPAHVEE